MLTQDAQPVQRLHDFAFCFPMGDEQVVNLTDSLNLLFWPRHQNDPVGL